MKEEALALVAALVETRPKFDALNKAAMELYGDFYPHQSAVAEPIYGPLVRLLNVVLGGDDADYFLHECRHMPDGGSVTINGQTWRLKTVDDLRNYLDAKDKL